MKELKAVSGTMKSTEEKETSYRVEKDGITRSVRVRKVENGYIIEVAEYGEKKSKKGEYTWYDERQTYISATDPLEDSEEDAKDVDVSSVIKNALANLKL